MPTSRRGRRASAAPTSIKQEEGTVSEEAGGNLGMIDGTTEMGYLLLSPCKVVVIHGIDDNYQRLPGKWIDVALDKTDDKEEENGEECDKNISCSYCNLVLETSKNNIPKVNNPLTLNVNTAGRFRGTISDMVHPKREEMREELASYHCQKRRSDAALLMGTVLDAQDHEYVSIRSLKLLSHPETETSQNKCTITASLLITLSFPALGINHSKQPASIVPFSRRPRNGINYKPLPPSVQFLLSILRSDWGQLDKRMKSIMDHSTSSNGDKKQTPSKKVPDYFPAKLSLEELYIRMQGSSSRLDSFSKNVTYGSLQQPTANDAYPNQRHLLNLPVDILQTQIAPFLRAKSLDSLRCSCKSLHDNLQSVVPGLKLRLYKHQVTSLQWMRQREIQPVSEAIEYALLSTREDTSSMEASEDNDPIRAMTGGQSVWLCSRPVSENASQLRQQGIRINQLTGNEMRTSTEQGFLARQGARGGLLCDDPGLGKTITVLSLILTTFGISMEVDKAKRVNPALSKPDDSFSPEERIFREYWKDEITPEFRRPAMGRLLSKLKRLSPTMGFFLRPIDPKLDGCEDYLDAIETPICLNDIYKKVSKDAYGHGNADFDAFVADVELCFL